MISVGMKKLLYVLISVTTKFGIVIRNLYSDFRKDRALYFYGVGLNGCETGAMGCMAHRSNSAFVRTQSEVLEFTSCNRTSQEVSEPHEREFSVFDRDPLLDVNISSRAAPVHQDSESPSPHLPR